MRPLGWLCLRDGLALSSTAADEGTEPRREVWGETRVGRYQILQRRQPNHQDRRNCPRSLCPARLPLGWGHGGTLQIRLGFWELVSTHWLLLLCHTRSLRVTDESGLPRTDPILKLKVSYPGNPFSSGKTRTIGHHLLISVSRIRSVFVFAGPQ